MEEFKIEKVTEQNINIENIENLNTPEVAAKLDNNPVLKEKALNRGKFLLEIAIGLGVAVGAAITMKDMGASTSGTEILSHLIMLTSGIAVTIKGVLDSNITASQDLRPAR